MYNRRLLLVDPNASEEPLLTTHVTVCLMENGGGYYSLEQIQQCITQTKPRYTELSYLRQIIEIIIQTV
jgi:hypothetical protein